MQPQYRQYPQQVSQQVPQRSPHVPNPRRGAMGAMMPAGPNHPVPLSQAQMHHQQQQQTLASEMAKRRSRKPTDRTLPDGLDETIVDADGTQRYRDLRDLERRLDATMTRKRLDIVDSASRNAKRYKTLRIFISNTVEDQIWQANEVNIDTFDFTPSSEASFRLKIEGRLLEDDGEADRAEEEAESGTAAEQSGVPSAKPGPVPTKTHKARFSHFIKSLTVEFDKSRQRGGGGQTIEWKKPERSAATANQPPASGDFDEITFKRNGDENVNVIINLYRHEDPERYLLAPELADVVDMTEATKQEVILGLWEYIKASGLQEDEDKRNFRCDDLLRKVVRSDVGVIPLLGEYIIPFCQQLPPIRLPYTVRVDEEFHRDPQHTVYDVRIAVDDPLRAKLYPFTMTPSYGAMLKEVSALDDQLALVVQGIANSKSRHSFFNSVSQDPANFIRNWASSQKRDLEVIMGEATRASADDVARVEWRRGGRDSIWASANARESVTVMLSKGPQPQR